MKLKNPRNFFHGPSRGKRKAGRVRNGKKSPLYEVDQRVFEVYNMIVGGVDRPTILRYALEKWDVKEGQAQNYISRARAEFTKQHDENKIEGLKQSVSRRLFLYRRAVDGGNDSLAHEILSDLDKLLNRYPALRASVKVGADEGLIGLLNGHPTKSKKTELKKD